jgi:hypothetical protein
MNRPRRCGRGRFNNDAKCRLPSRQAAELAKPEKSSTENLAAACRELISLTARVKTAQCCDVDDPDIVKELHAVEREWQRFKAERRRRQP